MQDYGHASGSEQVLSLCAPAGGFFGLQLAAQDSYQHAIVASAAQLLEFLKGLVTGLRRRKASVGSHVGVAVGNGENSRPERNFLAAVGYPVPSNVS